MKQFTFDLKEKTAPYKKHWEMSVGSCHAALALREDYRRQLREVHRRLGFRYLRFHGLFCDDMNVLSRSLFSSEYLLSFVNIDSIYDFLLSIGMKPFVELGFMPECLKSGNETIFHYKANITPPNDPDRWVWFIKEFISHLIERYGRDEVRTWYFEVWNEPNLDGENGLAGGRFWSGNMQDYYELYRITAKAVKEIDPLLRVGGPATSNNAHIPDMIAFCKENDLPLDFVSTHHYPTDIVLGYGVEDSKNFVKARRTSGRRWTAASSPKWQSAPAAKREICPSSTPSGAASRALQRTASSAPPLSPRRCSTTSASSTAVPIGRSPTSWKKRAWRAWNFTAGSALRRCTASPRPPIAPLSFYTVCPKSATKGCSPTARWISTSSPTSGTRRSNLSPSTITRSCTTSGRRASP